MRFYLDTSLVVTALVHEPASPTVHDWLEARGDVRFLVSDWVVTEFSAALCVKLRSRQISADVHERALTQFNELISAEFDCLQLDREQFRLAAAFSNRSLVGLRAGDALHLAIAATHAAKLCTRDRRLAEAGAGLGILTEFVPSLT